MGKYSEVDLANVQNYLLLQGNACPTIIGDEVHFIDQTRGRHRFVRNLPIDTVLESVQVLRKVDVEAYEDKAAFIAGSMRCSIDIYQIMEIGNKIFYREDLPLALRPKETDG